MTLTETLECICVVDCGEGDGCGSAAEHTFDDECRACTHAGEFHSHDDDPCPVHPENVVG